MIHFFLLVGSLAVIALNIFLVGAVIWTRHREKKARRAANYNAGLWAESAANLYSLELENAKLQGAFQTSQELYGKMSTVAREAIKVGETKLIQPFHVDDWPDEIG